MKWSVRSGRGWSGVALVAVFLAGVGFASVVLAQVPGSGSSLPVEEGAIAVEDLFEKPLELEVLKPAPIFLQLDARRQIGTLLADQKVTLVAVSDRAYRVRGKAQHGPVVGWVGTAFLKEPQPDFYARMKEFAARQEAVQELIENREVALGMTVDEAIASLGRPDERTSKVDANITKESLSYVTYSREPRTIQRRDVYGRIFFSIVYVKVETGRRTVHFEDGVLTSIEESEKRPDVGRLKIVPAPIIIF